jgi:ATP synthase I chain
MGPQHLRAMERWNLIFSGIAVLVAALVFERPVLVGVALGALIACVNFWAIRKIWESLLTGSVERRQTMQALFIVKMLALFAVVFVCIRFVELSAPALAVGLSIFLLSIVAESARYALCHPTTPKP